MGISVTGVERVITTNRKWYEFFGRNIGTGLEACAHELLAESQKLVPVDTEALKASGKVSKVGSGFGSRVSVSYDGPYAIYVHEDLTKYHRPPTQARYLAGAVPKVRAKMAAIIKRRIIISNK